MSGKFSLNKRSPSDNGILPFSESSGRGQDTKPRWRTGWVICYGMAMPLFSSLCNQISNWFLPFIFFPSFFGKRENNFSISFFRRIGKKKNTILLPKIAYRISKSDLFPNIAELMVVKGCVTFWSIRASDPKPAHPFTRLWRMVGLGVKEY